MVGGVSGDFSQTPLQVLHFMHYINSQLTYLLTVVVVFYIAGGLLPDCIAVNYSSCASGGAR